MKIFCCYTRAHQRLFEEFFKPSLDPKFELFHTQVDLEGQGDFNSGEYLLCLERKMELIVASIKENPNELIVWSDVDILFLQPAVVKLIDLMESSGKDILFQREGPQVSHVNPGFVVFRANDRVADFYGRVLSTIRSGDQKNDQFIINPMLPLEKELAWSYLPPTFYARTHGWPPGSDIILYHANFTIGRDGIGQKIAQFRELQWIRRHGIPALAWSCLKRAPGKLARSVAGRISKK